MEHRWAERTSLSAGFFPLPRDFEKRHWGYEENEFIETPMYPRHYYEAGCIKCHSAQMAVDRGDDITKATQTVELYGCYACHKINNWRFTDLRKPGPDLGGIAEKTTPEWAFRWISEPHNFRSTTRMPSFFYQRNMIDPSVVPPQERAHNIKLQDAEIHAIVSYLFDKSTHRVWQQPGTGDAGRGKQIVDSVGCMGCHIDTEQVKDEKTGQIRLARRDDFPAGAQLRIQPDRRRHEDERGLDLQLGEEPEGVLRRGADAVAAAHRSGSGRRHGVSAHTAETCLHENGDPSAGPSGRS